MSCGNSEAKVISRCGPGMPELQDGRVKRLPPEGFQRQRPCTVPAPAIHRVANHRTADMGHMDPDLMGPAGVELGPHQAGDRRQGGPKRFSSQYSVTARLPLVWRTAMRLRSTGWRPIGASIVPSLAFGAAPDQRLVDAGQVVGGEQLRERLVGGVVLGHHHDPRRVLVEPVDDPRPPHAADARQAVAAMGEQGVDQRLVGVAGRGMDDQPGRLVEDEEIVILDTGYRGPSPAARARPARAPEYRRRNARRF